MTSALDHAGSSRTPSILIGEVAGAMVYCFLAPAGAAAGAAACARPPAFPPDTGCDACASSGEDKPSAAIAAKAASRDFTWTRSSFSPKVQRRANFETVTLYNRRRTMRAARGGERMVCSARISSAGCCLLSITFLSAAAQSPPAPPSPRVELSSCRLAGVADDARCGVVEVFEDRAARSGRKIGIHLAVLPAKGPRREPDPIVVIPGGPGQDAVASARIFADLFAPARATRDLVLIDQRGTGASNPLNCKLPGSNEDPQGYLGDLIPLDAVRRCLQTLPADPALYTTPIAMEDLDEVRQALGYDRINLYGASYGTRAALVYMRAHPEHVRSAMLSGLVPTDMKIPLYQARDAQRAMDLLLDDCEADPACSRAFPGIRA